MESPKEINASVLRSLFELLNLSPGLAQLATQGSEEPVKQLQESVSALVKRVLTAGTDMQNRMSFWGQSLLREEESLDWRTRLEALKAFTESLAPYNTVGKLKNLKLTTEDIDAQKQNLDVLASAERMLEMVNELGGTAAYLSQAEMVLSADNAWSKQAQDARTKILTKLSTDRTAQHITEYRQTLAQLKKDYATAYIASHSKARLGVAEDKTKNALRKDSRLVAMRALAGISLMPTSQLTAFEDKLNNLKSCYQLSDTELVASPFCPHCGYKPASEALPFGVAANALTQLDDELDKLLSGWQQTLLDNLDDPIIQANLDLLKESPRTLIQSFVKSKVLPDPVMPEFVSAVQEALSGLEKIIVSSEDIKNALLFGGSPATPEDLRKRFENLLNDRCKGKDSTKLRFVIE